MYIRILFLALLISAAPLHATTDNNYDEIRVHSEKIESRLKDWSKRTDQHAEILSTSNDPKLARWRKQMDTLTFANELEELEKLTAIINQDVVYRDDYLHFHKKDFWATPDVTLKEGGDCEDIALLKAASLRRLGWPESRKHLLIGYLIERGKKESHAVLLVELRSGEQYVMRSITNQIVHPDDFAFLPVYAVDHQGTLIVKPHR